LGRGLEALLGKVAAQTSDSDEGTGVIPDLTTPRPEKGLDILLIDKNPYQPRTEFDPSEISSLAESIKTHGLLQPIVVRPHDGRYQLIAGERRLRAAMKAGWKEVPVHVIHADDRQMAELALTENLQRRDLNALEKAMAFQHYLDTYGGTHEELGKRLELDRSTVTNFLRLLELPEEIREMLRKGELTQGHAKAVLPLEEWEQLEICRQILADGWSVRQTEQYVRDVLSGDADNSGWKVVDTKGDIKPATRQKDDQTLALEQDFRNTLGSKVKLSHNNQGKGKIVISFASHDEFDRLYQLICRSAKSHVRGA
jgi:ParB family chromosome partitioning protein